MTGVGVLMSGATGLFKNIKIIGIAAVCIAFIVLFTSFVHYVKKSAQQEANNIQLTTTLNENKKEIDILKAGMIQTQKDFETYKVKEIEFKKISAVQIVKLNNLIDSLLTQSKKDAVKYNADVDALVKMKFEFISASTEQQEILNRQIKEKEDEITKMREQIKQNAGIDCLDMPVPESVLNELSLLP